MAKRVIESYTSDLSGEEIPEDSDGGTVTFTVSGANYEVDLTEKELAKFNKALEPFVNVARRAGRPTPTRTKVGSSAGGTSKELLSNIRSWARSQGMTVNDRGRISQELRDAYDASH